MPDSLSDFGLQVFASKLVIKFTKIQATAPCSRSASLLTFPKPPRFLHRKHSLLRATVTRVGDTVQQRRVCKQHRHFRFALFSHSQLQIWVQHLAPELALQEAVPLETECVALVHAVSCIACLCWGLHSKAEFREPIKYLCGKRCPLTHHGSLQSYGNLSAVCIDEGSPLDTTSRYVGHLALLR